MLLLNHRSRSSAARSDTRVDGNLIDTRSTNRRSFYKEAREPRSSAVRNSAQEGRRSDKGTRLNLSAKSARPRRDARFFQTGNRLKFTGEPRRRENRGDTAALSRSETFRVREIDKRRSARNFHLFILAGDHCRTRNGRPERGVSMKTRLERKVKRSPEAISCPAVREYY